MDLYNRQLIKMAGYYKEHCYDFPCNKESTLAEYLHYVASTTDRPKSQLCTVLAAVTCMFNRLGWCNPCKEGRLTIMVSALTKSATIAPMIKTKILPIKPFTDLFASWGDQILNIKQLRMKALCLLALVLMARPSDFAPQARVVNGENGIPAQVILRADQIMFLENGGMSITFHGIKNDYARDGFTVSIPKGDSALTDPVLALKTYMERTDDIRSGIPNKPLFLSLNKPFHALSAKGIALVLKEAIDKAGLGKMGFSAKCFRPTGATRAIKIGVAPDIVRHVGRWKSQEVFEKHYVHNEVPDSFTADVLAED